MAKAKKIKPTKELKPKQSKDFGRPSKYTEELATEICAKISSTDKGIHFVAKELNISVSTIFEWLIKYPDFSEKYTRARQLQTEFMREQMIEVSNHRDEDHTPFTGANVIQRDKLIVETLKWQMSKLNPKKYGDKIDVTSDGEKLAQNNVVVKMTIEEAKKIAKDFEGDL
jgi:hypothetical protein